MLFFVVTTIICFSDYLFIFPVIAFLSIQLGQFKSVNESQQSALKDKDSLLEQLKEVNESLQNDLKALKEIKPKSAPGNVCDELIVGRGFWEIFK